MTQTSAKGKSLRPDGQLRSSDGLRLLFKQDGVLVSAVLQELPYLLTAAVAGTEFQFFAMERNSLSEPLAIGPRLRLNSPKARALLTIAVINLHRLLRATQALLPGYVLPVDMVQKVTHQEGYTRTLCFKSDVTVHKTITMWSKFSAAWTVDFAELKQVNIRTARCAGLVHAVRGPTLDPKEDTYTVSLAPIGLQRGDAQPCNEQQAASAAHGLLHGLAALHKAGYTHRDLRWNNRPCSEDHRYFLLDLELCAKPGKAPFNMRTWPEGILQGDGDYTETSDILALGHMLSGLNIVTSPGGRVFLQQMAAGAHPDTKSPTV
eukprot:jgi/Astpho2/4753/Aster-00303